MLERDYIMRLIREFLAALARLLEKKEVTDRHEELKKLYDQYVGSYTFYHLAPVEKVIEALGHEDEEKRFYKMEMLAELYLAEADMVSKPEGDQLLEKSFALFDFLDHYSKTYSIDRIKKMDAIQQRLSNNNKNETKTT